ncbi:MAG: complex I subunit 5 family protein [Archaeoglobaceae archaeon]|nr:complex I subunit 5 family protein [Archaeoglobaceae archaeon]MCX8151929.1 complex I subunit 5 family protein [Archaeoglobaceae archaeon]MDW8013318.1 complex I subunit 5 family protein [Archaeoglobaceae archaeon]
MNVLIELAIFIPLIVTFLLPALREKAATALSTTSFLIPMVLSLYSLLKLQSYNVSLFDFGPPIGEFYILVDPVSNAFGFTICLVSAMVAAYSLPYMRHRFVEMLHHKEIENSEKEFKKYWFLYNFYAVSMLLLVYSGNFLLLYIFLEISLLTSFLLIYLYGYGNRQWVGILYFVWTHIAGVLALLGFLILAFESQTLAIKDLRAVSFVAWLLIFLGMIVKLPGLGAHMWLPWAHAEAPTPVSALLSPIMVGLAGYILFRVYMIDSSFVLDFKNLILAYGIATSIYAGLSVLKQTDYKRLLAYSTVSQMGYMLIALCLGAAGLAGLIVQYMSHAFGKSILFMTAGAIIATFNLRDIKKMGGMHEHIPTIANAALIGFMTLSGILTIGMFGEFLILAGVAKVYGFDLSVVLAVVVVFIISGFYSFYTMKVIYYGRPAKYEKPKFSRLLDAPLYVIAFFSVIFIFPPLATALINGLDFALGGELVKIIKEVLGGVRP